MPRVFGEVDPPINEGCILILMNAHCNLLYSESVEEMHLRSTYLWFHLTLSLINSPGRLIISRNTLYPIYSTEDFRELPGL